MLLGKRWYAFWKKLVTISRKVSDEKLPKYCMCVRVFYYFKKRIIRENIIPLLWHKYIKGTWHETAYI